MSENNFPKHVEVLKPKDHGLIELAVLDPTLKFDIRYATTDNFVGIKVYPFAKAYLLKHVADDLLKVHHSLEPQGLGLLIFDGYRPWSVSKIFWDTLPEEKRQFVADPAKGSVHNRGCAVDLSMVDLETGIAISMPSEFDETTERSYVTYMGGTTTERRARDLLRSQMQEFGFHGIKNEWWHFNHRSWQEYPVMDLSFEEIEKR